MLQMMSQVASHLGDTATDADWKDHSRMVERIVRGTIRSEDEAERSRWRVCIPETHCNKDVRYSGAEQWRHQYVSTASQNVIRSATRNQCRL